MSTRAIRTSSSGRRTSNAPGSGSRAAVAAGEKPQTTTLAGQNSIRSYFTPLSHSNSTNSQPNIPNTGKTNGLETRKVSRGHRSIVALPSAEISDAREAHSKPPTKISVTHPNGSLLQTTNGVRTRLTITHNDIPSGDSTPAPDSVKSAGTNPPQAGKPSKETRTLRSKDGGSRLKSDLSTYFANFDDIISDAPKAPEFLRVSEPIYIIDEQSKPPTSPPKPRPHQSSLPSRPHATSLSQPTPPLPTPNKAGNARTIPLTAVPPSSTQPTTDPLPDSHFFIAHRRAERKEKQLRNIEKEHAMHEKVHLERILEGLRGPDWLRVMGVTGITEGEQKDWKPKRDYFDTEVTVLVEKFRLWKEEEKRLRLEKERAREEEEDEEDEEMEEEEDADAGADSSDIDASAARQLQLEAGITPRVPPQPRKRPAKPLFEPASPERPFTSFYAKPHLRAAAMGSGRPGRNVTAFGRPIPDFEEHEFSLPDDYITADAIRANARKRRRMNREVKEGGKDE